MVFTGRHVSKLDSKNRVVIPAQYRRLMSERNTEKENSLYMIADERNECAYVAVFDRVGLTDVWPYTNCAQICHRDMENSQGRVVVPEELVAHAGLEDAVESQIIIAASPSGNHFEIWRADNFDRGYRVDIKLPRIWEL